MNFSDDEKIVLGEFCQHVLLSDAFTAITKAYEESTVQQLITTKATETKRRDELYFNLRGARDLLTLMRDLVNEHDRLLDNTPKPSDDDKPFDIYDAMPDDYSDDDVS